MGMVAYYNEELRHTVEELMKVVLVELMVDDNNLQLYRYTQMGERMRNALHILVRLSSYLLGMEDNVVLLLHDEELKCLT